MVGQMWVVLQLWWTGGGGTSGQRGREEKQANHLLHNSYNSLRLSKASIFLHCVCSIHVHIQLYMKIICGKSS